MHNDYETFWRELEKHYPISKWELRLPIATKLMDLDIDIFDLMKELTGICQQLLADTGHNSIEFAAANNGQSEIIPLLEGAFSGIIRFDCMINQDGLAKIIEVNADYPDGLIMHDKTYSVLSWRETEDNWKLFEQLFRKDETIFIIYKNGSFFLDAYYTEYLSLKKSWYKAHIGTFDDLEFRDDNVYYKGEKIDVVRRCMESSKFTSQMIEQFAGSNIRFINTFDLRTLGYKNLLQRVQNKLVPKTVELNTDNIDYAFKNKNGLVLKPSNLFEWKNVYIGIDTPESEWRKYLESNIENNFILQEYVESKKVQMEFYEAWKIETKEVYFDFCPHFFIANWEVLGAWIILSRFSEEKILNVSKGWWIGYVGV